MNNDLWGTAPPHPCERLAKMGGQSNFLSLLAGCEAGPDTTEDAAALSFCRKDGVLPEALEARWGGCEIYKRSLCQLVFDSLERSEPIEDQDRIWVKRAILDGYAVFAGTPYSSGKGTAKALGVRLQDFMATRKYAARFLLVLAMDAENPWIKARFSERKTP